MLSLARQFSIKSVLLQHGVILDNDNAYNYVGLALDRPKMLAIKNVLLKWGKLELEDCMVCCI